MRCPVCFALQSKRLACKQFRGAEMAHVFISASGKYAHFNRRLATSLSRAGIDGVWFEVDSIPDGLNWSNDLTHGLTIADVMVAVITPEALSSQAIQAEWTQHLQTGKPIIPVLLVPAKVHADLAHLPYIDFYTQSYETAFAQLYGDMARHGIKFNPITASLGAKIEATTDNLPIVVQKPNRLWMFISAMLLILVLILAGLLLLSLPSSGDDNGDTAESALSSTIPASVVSTDRPRPTQPSDSITLQPTFTPQPTPTVVITGLQDNTDWTPVTEAFYEVEMVLVPEGCFLMGNTRGEDNEQPAHQICFDTPFWIDRYEVTNAQYRRCVDDGVCDAPSIGTYFNNSAYDVHPVVYVNWFQTNDYAQWRGCRLPSEAEWEYAARGIDGWLYPWGNDFDGDNVVYQGNADEAQPIGSRSDGESWVGAYDLSGNVWEWVSTIYEGFDYPYNASDGREDPADTTSTRVLRGGSFGFDELILRASNRFRYLPLNRDDNVGFRCARDYQLGDLD